ncbi:MAG: hypothetical protein WBM43_12745 [Flavobacteriaceae bacterium]
MLKFFRNIRQNLLSENKFSKYLVYAVGEILLVVIGILVALQINQWKQEQDLKQLEKTYLKRLLIDLDHDVTNIEAAIADIDENQSIIKSFISSFNNASNIDSLQKSMTAFFENGWLIFEFVPSRNTYIDLSQTGNMKVITNTSLVNDIISYYGYITQVEESNNVNKNWITPIDQAVAKETPAFEIDPSTSDLFINNDKSIAIKNLFANKDLLSRDAAGHYWINRSLKDNLIAIKGLTLDLQESIKSDLNKQ